MKSLETILDQYNFLKRNYVSGSSITDVENLIGFRLPDDYKFFITNYAGNDEFIGPAYLCLWDLDELVEINRGYHIIQNLPNTIGIGSNGSSECIAIELLAPGNYRVVLTPFIDLSDEYHIEIGSSFTDMLYRLDFGKEWFS